jgi:hypothetical protein
VALVVDELVDPLDAHGALPVCLDGERRRVVQSRPRLLSAVTAPYPHTVVAGNPLGKICWEICRIEIS